MQIRRRLDLSSQVGVMLSGNARHSIGRLASTIDTVTSGTNMRVQFLSDTEMLSRALSRAGVRIQT